MAINVMLADDQQMIREGITSMLERSEVNVQAQVDNGADLIKFAAKFNPDVILCDIHMPELDGLATLETLKRDLPHIPVLMLTVYDNPTYIANSVALGAYGYLLKGIGREDLLEAIRAAAENDSVWSRESLARIMRLIPQSQAQAPSRVDSPLTKRETEVLREVAAGLSNKQIAKALHISIETVKEHVHNILRKTNLDSRTQAAVWAVQSGIVPMVSPNSPGPDLGQKPIDPSANTGMNSHSGAGATSHAPSGINRSRSSSLIGS